MNIYDTRIICCVKCEKFIGEIAYDAKVIRPLCGQCENPTPDLRDHLSYNEPIAKPHEVYKKMPSPTIKI